MQQAGRVFQNDISAVFSCPGDFGGQLRSRGATVAAGITG